MIQVQNKTIETEEGIFNGSINKKALIQFNGQTVSAAEYFPVWINNLADDVTLEGSLIYGFVQGSKAVLAIVDSIRKIYEHQEYSLAGPFGENLFFENYTGWVKGEPIGCLVMVIRNAAGQAQHIAASYRPLNTVLLLSRLVKEYFDGSPLSEHFVDKKFDSSTNDSLVRRKQFVSNRPFGEVLQRLTATIGKPDMNEFFKAITAAKTNADLEEVVHNSIGSSDLMEFIRFDPGEVLRIESGGQGAQMIRLVVGNPVTMRKLVKIVPDAAAYAPVSILVDERRDGVHLSYDSMAGLIAPYGNAEALAVAEKIDAHLQHLLETAAR